MMTKPNLTILWFPDCTMWEVEFLTSIAKGLGKFSHIDLVRIPSANIPRSDKWGKKVWLVSHDWRRAVGQLGRALKGREVWISVLGLPSESGSLFTLLWRRLMMTGYPPNSRIISHSPINYRFFREMEGFKNDRLSLLPFGVASENKSSGPRSSTDKQLVVGTFSRFVPESNLNYILNVAHYVVQNRPDTIFRILGTGPLYHHLVHSVRELGLESRVEVVETEFSAFLEGIDIFLYPPTRNDHFLPLFGAAEYRRPVVAVDLPGVEEYIVDAKTGFLVSQHETKAMAELVIRLIDHQPLREAMGAEYQKQIFTKFSLEKVTQSYADLFWGQRVKTPVSEAA